MPQDFYGLLGISRSATKEQVRNAYLGLVRKYHPDINKELETDDLLKEVNHAYEILSDDESRAAYNLALREDEPLEFAAKLYSLKSVAMACSVTAVLGSTFGYSFTLLQPRPAPVVVMVPPPAPPPPDRAGIEKVLESIQDVPSLRISAVAPSQQEIPTASTLVMDRKRPSVFGSNQEFADSSTKELKAVQIFRLMPVKRAKISKPSAARKSPVLANAKRVKQSPTTLASKPDLVKSPSLKVSSSPEAILSAIPISMEDGSSVPANTLLKVDTRIWKWNRGRYRKKLSKFISVLIESKDIALASKQSGLSLREIRSLVKQV
jgi:curved DNA-binding protein CbpA